MAFLDRFSYKKPKQKDLDGSAQRRGISRMQPRVKPGASIYAEAAVNSQAFVGQSASTVRDSTMVSISILARGLLISIACLLTRPPCPALPACLPACVPTCLPACLPAFRLRPVRASGERRWQMKGRVLAR